MEPKEILERIKLMMNYDSKKTLTENREFLNEAVDITNLKIYEKIDEACGDIGTDPDKLSAAFDLIARNWKDSSWLSSFDKYMKQAPIDGGMGDMYTSLQEVLNGELGADNCDNAKEYAAILNRIQGIKANYRCFGAYDMIANSFKITYTPTQKQVGNQSDIQRIAQNALPCLASQLNNKSLTKEYKKAEGNYPEGVKITYKSGTQQFLSTEPPLIYDYKSQMVSKYTCEGNTIKPTQWFDGISKLLGTSDETPKVVGGGGSPGSTKGGSNQPYPWKDAPSIADVQSGKATIYSGMKGDSVTEIQNLLNASGAKLKADGKFGGRTKSALKAFQKKSGTTNQKGVVDADTYNKLKSGNKESVEIDNTSIDMNSSSGDNKKTNTEYDVIDSGAGPSSNSITM